MLKNLKVDKCPICGCTEVIEESVNVTRFEKPEIHTHCNGERWEHRQFLCGYRVEHIPNFMSDKREDYADCFYDPEVQKKREKSKKTSKLKKNFLETLEYSEISDEAIASITKVLEEIRKKA